MNVLNPAPALAAVVLALICAKVVTKFEPVPEAGRHAPIDGLRGFLAFFVFIHHASYWYFFVRTGTWGGIHSHLYRHLGESSVAMFFMITAFLFFSKLLDSRARPINWLQLYRARFWRLAPLYLFAMSALFIVVAIESNFTLQVPFIQLTLAGVRWLLFSIFGQPDLNGVRATPQILAGVTWSLPYEWAFYLSLPLLGLVVRASAPAALRAICAIAVTTIAVQLSNDFAWLSFCGGIAAAFAARSKRVVKLACSAFGSTIAIASLMAAVIGFHSAYSRPVLPLLSITFVIIACGNSFFGLLTSGPSRVLGQMGYSIYLLHGLVLYGILRGAIGSEALMQLNPIQYWLVIMAVIPPLIAVCTLTYRYVELPGMAVAKRLSATGKASAGGNQQSA